MSNTAISSILRAKKNHLCDWCGEKINIGEPYKRYRWYNQYGDAGTTKLHPECLEAENKLDWKEYPDGYDFGIFNRGCGCENGNCYCKEKQK